MNDGAARERAAHAFDENVVVVAGAGTGKTSLLVERVICQMIARDLGVDDFAAITFTEKAAAEMRKRLASSLAELGLLASSRTSPSEADQTGAAGRAYAWLLGQVSVERIEELAAQRLRDLERADISTIHSFCARLLRRYPVESGVDPRFSVDAGLGFDELQRDVWSAFLSGSEGPGGPQEEVWQRVLAKLDLAELETMARACASFRLAEQAVEGSLPDARAILAKSADVALGVIAAHVTGSTDKGPESWLDAARGPLIAFRDQGIAAFRAAIDRAICRDGRGKERPLLDSVPPTLKGYETAAKRAKELHRLLVRWRLIDDELLSDALNLLRPFAIGVRREARLRGVLPYDALLSLARDLLRDRAPVRNQLGQRFKALFVDEFQDTDPLQYEIVFFLAETPSSDPAAHAYATRLAPGKLFIVGDPKQAIYRFRGADIDAYNEAIFHVVEENRGVRLDLVTNFRALPEVLEPIDRLFGPMLSAPDPSLDFAYSGYSGLFSGLDPVDGPCVEIWTVGGTDCDRDADEGRHAEAAAIAAWVEAEISADRLAPKDIALLFRAMNDVHVYARALQDRGVPCLIGRSEELESQPASRQLLALLRALANPADAPAVLGVLRSPLGAVPDAELARWAGRFNGREREACWSYPDFEPSAKELPNLSRAFGLLRELHSLSRQEAPEHLLIALLESTPLLEIHASARDGERRAQDLWYLAEHLVEVAQAMPGRDLADLVRELEGEERRPSVGDSELTPDRVRLFSIHGAKGLEFPVVILADLARGKGGGKDESVEVKLVHVGDDRALAISTRAGISASWIELERQEEIHATAESGRLFYVACTRAMNRLIFVHAPRKTAPPAEASIHYLEPWGYPVEGLEDGATLPNADDVIARAVPIPAPTDAIPPAIATPIPTEAIARASRAAAMARDAARSPFSRPSGLREDAEERALARDDLEPVSPAAIDTPDRAHARALGTALHDALERWNFSDADALRDLVRTAAARTAVEESVSAELLVREALALAEGILASDLPAHLAGVEVLGRELPILFRDSDGTAWNGTIDLLYRDSDGCLVVADYKTDRAPDEAAREHYREQLSTYARGVGRGFPGEPALELIWLRSGKRERLRLESDA